MGIKTSAQAAFMTVPVSTLVPLPDELTFECRALAETFGADKQLTIMASSREHAPIAPFSVDTVATCGRQLTLGNRAY